MSEIKKTFRAFRIEETEDSFRSTIMQVPFDKLRDEELLVRVQYSALNYKDALSATGNRGVTKQYPHTPGIDAVGTVVQSNCETYEVGDVVIVTSFDLGMNTDGGFADYIRVPAQWAIKLPAGLSMKESMIYGTAGLTAAMSVKKITESIAISAGKIAVSGATGGVGALSVALLHKLGYEVVAISGKKSETDYLQYLGASQVLDRHEIEAFDKKPLLKPIFAGAVDTVGGVILENIIKATKPLGVVTCCGNVASPKLDLTVFPFILRGISLIGIDSQNYPVEPRAGLWQLLASSWKPDTLAQLHQEIRLTELQDKITNMLQGQLKGRIVINLSA
ncbi:YhdH/YhfP family quinone oxidoreductase [Dyadobacter tibetensis]|uniref:YhdH/YhfP family quinone oxidoreductase n=1 Tax=Dyadobacter tibetensis TaxID=1211851 RepID=UPI00046F01E2|nr:YhdH/YhfP family quinone oxidoreductase [Dyadobacter tibetensis]